MYCPNCGNDINNNKKCNNCKSEIVDKNKINKLNKIGVFIGLGIILIFIIYIVGKYILFYEKVNDAKELAYEYVEETYGDDYVLYFDEKTDCVIDGDCKRSYGCDGSGCEEYTYLDENECESYVFNVNKDDKYEFEVTVVIKDGKTYVVKGRNIYGEDEDSEDEIEIENNIDY